MIFFQQYLFNNWFISLIVIVFIIILLIKNIFKIIKKETINKNIIWWIFLQLILIGFIVAITLDLFSISKYVNNLWLLLLGFLTIIVLFRVMDLEIRLSAIDSKINKIAQHYAIETNYQKYKERKKIQFRGKGF